VQGQTRQAEFRRINSWGQVPVAKFDDGRVLGQSGALILHFAEGSDLIPADPFERSRMLEWMFWEQYSHEPYVAVRRFLMTFAGKTAEELDPKLFERGNQALAHMEVELSRRDWFAGGRLSLADIALAAYTRMAGDGGFDLARYPRIEAWIARVEVELGLSPYAGVEAQGALA
jgi:glutathione S-transferase